LLLTDGRAEFDESHAEDCSFGFSFGRSSRLLWEPGIACPEVEMGGRGGLRCTGTLFELHVGPPWQMLP
jgi:hypothetical protein